MKINSVHIDGFGKWNNQTFALDDHLQVILGDNEAGKSTLANFIVSVLFGYANGHNQYSQYLPRQTNAYGGTLDVTINQQQYHIKRSSGKKGGQVEIVNEAGQKVPSHFLEETLGAIDADLYGAIYRFSQKDLSQILDLNKEDLAQYLQKMGAVGSSGWLDLKKDYTKQADELYKPKGRKPVLNQQLKEYQTLQEKIQTAGRQYDRYQELQTTVQTLEGQLTGLKKQIESAQQRFDQLETLRPLMPLFEKVNQQTTQQVVKITQTQLTDSQSLNNRLNDAQQQVNQLTDNLNVITETPLSEFAKLYRDHLKEIDEIKTQIPAIKVVLTQIDEKQHQLSTNHAEFDQISHRYSVDPLPSALTSEQEDTLQTLLKEREAVQNQSIASRSNRQPEKIPLIWWLLGAVLIVAVLFLPTVIKVIAGLGLLGTVGYLYYQRTQMQRDKSAQDREQNSALTQINHQIDDFADRFGLSQIEVTDWLPMQSDLRRLQQLSQSNQQTDDQLKQLTDQRNQYATQLQALGPTVQAQSLTPESLDDLNQQIDTAHVQVTDWQSEMQKRNLIKDQIKTQTTKLSQFQNAQKQLFQEYDVANQAEFEQLYQQSFAQSATEQTNSVMASQLTDEQKEQLSQFENMADLSEQSDDAKTELNELTGQIKLIEKQQASATFEIESLAQNGTLTVLLQKKANLQTEINESVKKWLEQSLAVQWIDQALQLASADRFPQIIERAQQYFCRLTDNRYATIHLTDSVIYVTDQNGESFDVGELSTGTAEQLYIALRLGFVQVMGDLIDLPIMIDDGFVNFDHSRKQTMFEILGEIAKTHQVLYFTTDDRMIDHTTPILNLNEMQV
ncbi:ATP-binding protein [Paucilactobacillus sp. N302-9]